MALKHVADSMRSGFTSAVEHIEHIIIAFVLVAAMTVAVLHGFEIGSNFALRLVFATVLVAAIAFEFRGARRMIVSLYQKQFASAFGWCTLWAVCASATLYTSFGTAARNVDDMSAHHKAAFVTYGDVRKDRDDALQAWNEAKTATKQVRDRKWSALPVVDGKQIETVEAAAALIRAGEADGFYQKTSQCTDAKGKQASAHCNKLGEARAAKSSLEARARLDEELRSAEQKEARAKAFYETAKAKADTTDTKVSDETPHVKMLASMTGMNERQARIFDGMSLPIVMQALLSLAAILLAIEECRKLPSVPWFNWSALWYGRDHGVVYRDRVIDKTDHDFRHKLAQAKKLIEGNV